jgi:hypothetical protein
VAVVVGSVAAESGVESTLLPRIAVNHMYAPIAAMTNMASTARTYRHELFAGAAISDDVAAAGACPTALTTVVRLTSAALSDPDSKSRRMRLSSASISDAC